MLYVNKDRQSHYKTKPYFILNLIGITCQKLKKCKFNGEILLMSAENLQGHNSLWRGKCYHQFQLSLHSHKKYILWEI